MSMSATLTKKNIRNGACSFSVGIPQYRQTVLEAMAEAQRISRDPNVKGYSTMEELKASLEAD